jgi:hypothetical protein
MSVSQTVDKSLKEVTSPQNKGYPLSPKLNPNAKLILNLFSLETIQWVWTAGICPHAWEGNFL